LVGIARSVSDFSYCTDLSDLAVRVSHQRQGIGRELIRRTRESGGQSTVILLSAPKVVDYYPHIGLKQHPSAWTLASDASVLQLAFCQANLETQYGPRMCRATSRS
jgi:predicted N-acetyltransferase YhbS